MLVQDIRCAIFSQTPESVYRKVTRFGTSGAHVGSKTWCPSFFRSSHCSQECSYRNEHQHDHHQMQGVGSDHHEILACTRCLFPPLRQKPVLTDEDIEARLAFAEKFETKSAAWWNSSLQMIIDVKHYRVLPHGSARRHAAQEATRGTYRKKGQGLSKGHTKPLKTRSTTQER